MRVLPALLLLLSVAATAARADTSRALDQVILPGVVRFAEAAQRLSATAAANCARDAVRPAYHAARDAWGAFGDFRLGPTEQAALTIAFWPDDRASGLRAIRAAVAAGGGQIPLMPASARGFPGLDLLLGEPGLEGDAGCALVAALAADLSDQARVLQAGWQAHAPLLRNPGNAAYFDLTDAQRVLYTQALAALEQTRDARLGRPLGEAGRPRPARAEQWRTARPLPNVVAATQAAHALARALVDAPTQSADAALADVLTAASAVSDPAFQDMGDPQARLRVEILQQRVGALHAAIIADVGQVLGVGPGFNALDGD